MKKKFLSLMFATAVVVSSSIYGADQIAPNSSTTVPAKIAQDQSLVRKTVSGQVQGIKEGESLTWYGIPYAAAPVDELRWQAPKDHAKWDDVLDCTQPAKASIQCGKDYTTGKVTVSGTEDCLNLDVYTTENAKDLPVLVYIHGGNNQTGSSSEIAGNEIVVKDHCVYVSLNYRLGILGFNCLPAFMTDEKATGNYTLLDIAKALDWVKANIASFGGDPENITVSGFSAGGRDVMAMLASPLFKGKFDKAIAFSGGMTIADETASASQIAAAIAPLAVEDGKAKNVEAAKAWLLTDGSDVKDYLYSISAERLCTLMANAGIRMSVFPHLFNDGVTLPKEGFATTTYNNVPLLMLTGSTEFSLFCNFDEYYQSPAMTALDKETQAAAVTFAKNYGSDMYRIFNAQCSAETMYDHYKNNIFLCQIEYGSDKSQSPIPMFGSFHGIFVPMLTSKHSYATFGDFSGAGYQAMSTTFNSYLSNFLATGNPNGKTLEKWNNWTPENKQTMVFDADQKAAIIKQENVSTTYEDIIKAMDADTTLPKEVKLDVISHVMNGRWFSDALDKAYKTPSLWQ